MTATMTKTQTSKRQARIHQLQDTLAHEVEALRDPQRWIDWLEYCARFHHYSGRNQLLIQAQRPGATLVAGYRGWQARGRQVRRGERAIWIWGGRPYRRTTDTQDTDDDKTDSQPDRGIRFFPVCVFDISQTEPLDGHETPTHPFQGSLTGQDTANIAATVRAFLESRNIRVVTEPLRAGVNGCTFISASTEKIEKVSISPDLSPAGQADTLLHELAHIELGHVSRTADYHGSGRALFEVEAESVAYVVANLMGLDTTPVSAGYIASWTRSADNGVIESTANHVATTAHAIAQALHLTD